MSRKVLGLAELLLIAWGQSSDEDDPWADDLWCTIEGMDEHRYLVNGIPSYKDSERYYRHQELVRERHWD